MEEERIGLFLDFENLAIGAREQLKGTFDFKPIADALAERGRVVVRRAYADWSMFGDAGRELTRHHIELIEIPQRMGAVRKNAADIKLAVDAIQLSYERDFVTTFVIGTGDSDFTPLVHKLRELNKRVIGIGIEASTSALLPPACDEFLFYERLQGVEGPPPSRGPRRGSRQRSAAPATSGESTPSNDIESLGRLITQTLSGMKRRSSDVVLGSSLKRTLLRKDPTFDEANYGFRSLGELLNNLAERDLIQLIPGSSQGDPQVDFPHGTAKGEEPFQLLRDVVTELGSRRLTGLKNQLRKRDRDFSEKKYGYGGFLQFVKAAQADGFVDLEWDDEDGEYVVHAPGGKTSEVVPAEAASEEATTEAVADQEVASEEASTASVLPEEQEPEAPSPRKPARPRAKAKAKAKPKPKAKSRATGSRTSKSPAKRAPRAPRPPKD